MNQVFFAGLLLLSSLPAFNQTTSNHCPADLVAVTTSCSTPVRFSAPLSTRSHYLTQTANNQLNATATSCVNSEPLFPVTAASYLRVYNLPAMGISQYRLTAIEFGVRLAQSGQAGWQPLHLNVYAWDTATPLALASFQRLATAQIKVANQQRSLITEPLSVVIPPGKAMVLEVAVPEGSGTDRRFVMGATTAAATAPSYLQNPCTNHQLRQVADLPERPNYHWVLNAQGVESRPSIQTAGLPSGSLFPVGTTVNSFEVEQLGTSGLCSFSVTVRETQPPVLSTVQATPQVLQPANGLLADVKLAYTTTDNCGVVGTRIASVSCNQPFNAAGSPNPDVEIVNERLVRLRARSGHRFTPRIYTITVEATDASGNLTTGTTTVTVPPVARSPLPFGRLSEAQLYPNPATGRAYLQLPRLEGAMVEAVFLNASGQVVRRQLINGALSEGALTLSLEGLPAGLYVLRLQAEGETTSLKLLVR